MTAKETLIRDALKNDSAWAALVTGGTYLYDELGRLGLTPETATYDANGKLKLTAVITFSTVTAAEHIKSERQFFTVYFYADSDYSLIRQARRKCKDILNRLQLAATTDEGTPFVWWVNDGADFIEDELGGALASFSRYAIQYSRY